MLVTLIHFSCYFGQLKIEISIIFYFAVIQLSSTAYISMPFELLNIEVFECSRTMNESLNGEKLF